MRVLIDRKPRLAPLLLLLTLGMVSCFSRHQKLELSKYGDCPKTEDGQRIFAEGYFNLDSDRGAIGADRRFERPYPYTGFMFSTEPNSKSKFVATLYISNMGENDRERGNNAELIKTGPPAVWHIYDHKGQEIGSNDKVRITGSMRSDCMVKVSKIEKL